MMFQKGGNAVDAACAMLAATCTMWDTLRLGRRDAGADLQPEDRRRSSASTRSASPRPARRRSSTAARACAYPPEYGPLAAVTPGTPGGLMVMLAEYGTLSLARGARAGDPDGRRLPDRGAARRRDRARQGRDQGVAVLARASSCRTRARRARRPSRARSSPAGPRRHAAQAGRGRAQALAPARAARRRSTRPTTASTAATSREELVRGVARAGRAVHAGGPRATGR